ncbi:hypothetical protein CO123_01065 [bacterium (Candidatus Howlettbacteria) CG_4_9_14_3_um_filter_37_10]|nr:MAG: hypothetical protein CO123_01065 [bacterium (Candidatus Howlettbacteria) CG_4_9_14_3_um_filter_37_10]
MSLDLIYSIIQEIIKIGIFFFSYTWWIFVLIFAWEAYQNRRKTDWVENMDHVILKVEVPKNNEKGPVAAEMMFASLHGILKDAEDQRREGSIQEHISFEIVASLNNISFYIWLPVYLKDYLEGQLYAQYPSAEITIVNDYSTQIGNGDDGYHIYGTEISLEKDHMLPIKSFISFEVDPLASITSVLSKLDDLNEQIWIQYLIQPEGNDWQSKSQSHTSNVRSGNSPMTLNSIFGSIKSAPFTLPKTLISMALKAPEPSSGPAAKPSLSKHEEAEMTAIDTKAMKLGYNVKIRVIYASKNPGKVKYRLQAVAGSFKQFNTTLNGFVSSKTIPGKTVLDEYRARFFDDGFILNIEELASIYHLPHVSVETPNINWVSSKKSAPPANLPLEGSSSPEELTLFGQTNFRGNKQKFGIKKEDRSRHMYIIGKSGVGKSYSLALLSISDIYAGHGVCIIDPHGDLAEMVIKYIPEYRIKDVVYFNPADTLFPIAFNALECPNPDFKEMIASGFVSIFKKQFGYSWGPRLEYVLRYTILALLDTPDSTMLGVIRMLTEKNFRQKIIKNIKDPVVRNFWEKEYATYNDRFATEAVAPILNKVGQFIASPLIRNIVGQPVSTVDVRKIMDEEKILIINLSSGRIGEDNSALLGSMMITKIQLAAMSRADIPAEERKDFYLYVDEFQNFATESFAKILSEARKYRLDLIVANQYITQMEETVRDAVFGNVGTLISYRVGAKDATFLENEFSKLFTSEDLINLDNRHIYLKMLIDGVTRQPFSAQILNLLPSKIDHSKEIYKYSRDNFARSKDEVEDLINKFSTSIPQNENGEEVSDSDAGGERRTNNYATKRPVEDKKPSNFNREERPVYKPRVEKRNEPQLPRHHDNSSQIIERNQTQKKTMKQPVKQFHSRPNENQNSNYSQFKKPYRSNHTDYNNSSRNTSSNKHAAVKPNEQNLRDAIQSALAKKQGDSSNEATNTNNRPNTASDKNNNNIINNDNNIKDDGSREIKPGETIVFK